ncbi:hypothetical protein BJX64DRAFT_247212 [Aspergillus heterothallicus]
MSSRAQQTALSNHNTMLQIELDSPATEQRHPYGKEYSYKPGDTISGHVYRSVAAGMAHSAMTITVTLRGRSTSELKLDSASESVYSRSFDIFDGCVETLVLYSSEGNYTGNHDNDAISWPFAFTIPFSVRDVRDYMQHSTAFYSSPDGSEGPTFIPPGSFLQRETNADDYSGRASAEIAYTVEAKMERTFYDPARSPAALYKVLHTASAPFELENVSLSSAITDFGSKVAAAQQRGIYSYKLIPGIDELSLAQRARKALMSSKVPGFALRVSVCMPVFLQIGNDNLLPVSVSFEAVSATVSDILEDVPQTVTITSLAIRIRSKTAFRADKTIVRHLNARTLTRSGPGVAILPRSAILDLRAVAGQEISTTVTPSSSSSSAGGYASQPLDLGAILDFRLRERELHPTFTTYNIAQTWELSWELGASIVGETMKFAGAHEVVVLPRACEAGVLGFGAGAGPVVQGGDEAVIAAEGPGEKLPEYGKDEELPPYSA